ncbi:hypothetical protein M8C21_016837, partial [Ambrosia artemisiifolia]
LKNPDLLNWPDNGDDDPCGSHWPHVFCSQSRVTQIQVQGLQKNQFTGSLPSLNGLSGLSLEVMVLDNNPLNVSSGWVIPDDLMNSVQLQNLSLMSCNVVGKVPDFLGGVETVFKPNFGSDTGILWLNGQSGEGMSGGIDVIGRMSSLTSLWLHGNRFSGKIPESIGGLVDLKEFDVNSNDLVGLVPEGLASLKLDNLDLNNNMFMGPVPKFKAVNFSYSSNRFCQPDPGVPCGPEVTALLGFLDDLGYPSRLVDSWSGNDPCGGAWFGLSCGKGKVSAIHLAKFNLSGSLSPSVGNLESLTRIDLGSNYLTGVVPANWSSLKSLTLLDLSNNNLSPPLPKFNPSMKLVLGGNPLFESNSSKAPPESIFAGFALLIIPLCIYLCKKKKVNSSQPPSSLVIHPRDPSDSDNTVKISIANDAQTHTSAGSGSGESHVIESGNLIISVQVLKNVTKNFAQENELGRGGFGVVYKGQLDDGTKIAVKRMESGVISHKALDEFQAEIEVLSKVRHRHLVSLLGYSTEGPERILVYEYMPQGALSRHLFHWKTFKLEPLSWKRRLNIALDVARGMEYLHTLAHQSFIHRDLKST